MPLRVSAFSAVLVSAAVVLFGGQPQPTDMIAPKKLVDGSIEYRLIDFGADGRRFTEDDPVWVLRFPSSLDVHVPDLHRSREQIAANPNWKNNWELSMTLGPSGDIVAESSDPRRRGIKLRATAARVDYGIPGEEGWLLGSTFSAQVSRLAHYQCHQMTEEFTGVWRLREQTQAETKALRARLSEERTLPENRTGFVGKCRIEGTNFDRYVAYDRSNALIGHGTCSRMDRGECTFIAWLPQKREIILQFDKDSLSDLRRIYASVVGIFSRATDTQSSKNI